MKMRVSASCPKCELEKEFLEVPEPFEKNVELMREKSGGDITNLATPSGLMVCVGCLDRHEIKFINKGL